MAEDHPELNAFPQHVPGAEHDVRGDAQIRAKGDEAATGDDAAAQTQDESDQRRDGKHAQCRLPAHESTDHRHQRDVSETDRRHSQNQMRRDARRPHQSRTGEQSAETPRR